MYETKQQLVTCQQCHCQIYNQVWQIHKLMCQSNQNPKQKQSKRKASATALGSNSNSNNKIKISLIKRATPISQKIEQQKQNEQKQQQQQQQIIPCLECGNSYPFTLYAYHQNQCIGHQTVQCRNCGVLYPVYLIQEHNSVCPNAKEKGNGNNYGKGNNNNDNGKSKGNNNGNYNGKVEVVHDYGVGDENGNQGNNIQNQQYDQDFIIISDNQSDYSNNDNEYNHELANLIQGLAITDQKQKQQGLTKQQVAGLPSYTVTKQEDCSICCTPMKKIQRNVRLKCRHIFHRICLEPWLINNPHCPMCRQHALKK